MTYLGGRGGPGTHRRRLAGILLAGATASAVWSLVDAALVSADSANLPGVFTGMAGVAGVHEEAAPKAGFAVYQPFYGTFADGFTLDSPTGNNFTSTGILARASTFFPGATIANPSSLICQLQCGAVPAPPFPLTVETTGSPPTVSQQTSTPIGGTGQIASGQAAAADATAYPPTGPSANPGAGVGTQSVVTGMDFPGSSAAAPAGTAQSASTNVTFSRAATAAANLRRQLSRLLHRPLEVTAPTQAGPTAAASPAVMSVGSSSSSTYQHFDQHGTLFATAETHLSGITMLGGLIQVSSIDSVSNSSGNGGNIHTHSDHVTVGAVTVGGVPATIGSDGISVTGQGTGSAPINALNSALQQALSAAGMQITFSGPTTKPAVPLDGCQHGQADGVNVTVAANVNSVPVVGDQYNLVYTLGSVCTSVQASNPGAGATAGNSGQSLLALAGSSGAAAPASGGGSASGGAVGTPASNPGTGNSGPTGAPTSSATKTPSRSGRAVATAALGPLTSRHVWSIYLAVVLAMAAVLVGAGVQLRPLPRRPRPRPGRPPTSSP